MGCCGVGIEAVRVGSLELPMNRDLATVPATCVGTGGLEALCGTVLRAVRPAGALVTHVRQGVEPCDAPCEGRAFFGKFANGLGWWP